jgi:hypothetical protein
VVVGDTETEVPVTVPTPLLIDSVGAGLPETVHDNFVELPDDILDGVAVKEEMAGALASAPARTVTGTPKVSPFNCALILAVVVVVCAEVVTGKETEVAPNGTVTDAEVPAAAGSEVASATTVPLAGAELVSVTDPVMPVPPKTVLGEISNAESRGFVLPPVPSTSRTGEGSVTER